MPFLNRTLPAAALLLVAAAAMAAPVTLTLTGAVSRVDAPLAGVFNVGDAVSVTLVYDTAAPAVLSNANGAEYDFLQFRMSFGTYSASFASGAATESGFVSVSNNVASPFGPADAFGASAFQTGGGAAVAGVPLQQGFIGLWDATETAFAGNALPSTLSLAAFGAARAAGLPFCRDATCGVGSLLGMVTADLGAMTVSGGVPVPEPGTAWLACAGLALLARSGTGRRRLRH